MRRAVFLEKNGPLVGNLRYDLDPQRVMLARGAAGALRALKAHGYLLVVASNQPAVALGHCTPQTVAAIERRIQELLAPSAVALDGFYYCPHLPQAANVRYAVMCLCRKPQPGLLRQAARDWQIDLTASWLVGDTLDDIEAGSRAGCRTVLVDSGAETEWRLGTHRQPLYLAGSLRQATHLILAAAGRAPRDPKDNHGEFGVAS